jgi:hypothetical protein
MSGIIEKPMNFCVRLPEKKRWDILFVEKNVPPLVYVDDLI